MLLWKANAVVLVAIAAALSSYPAQGKPFFLGELAVIVTEHPGARPVDRNPGQGRHAAPPAMVKRTDPSLCCQMAEQLAPEPSAPDLAPEEEAGTHHRPMP